MEGNKKAILANFNCTFGDSYEPMLCYFEKIIYPALSSKDISRKNKKKKEITSNLYFADIKVVQNKEFGLMLKGKIVKDKDYKVKSLSDENKNIKDTNITHPTSPYSFFIILLKNHRMIYIKNQAESPSLNEFKITCEFFLKNYTDRINEQISLRKNPQKELFLDYSLKKEISPLYKDLELLPMFNLDVIEQLDENTIKQFINEAYKIERFSIRVEVQNPEAPFSGILKDLENSIKDVGGSAIDSTWESPKKKEALIDIASQSNGRGKIICVAQGKDGTTKKLSDQEKVKYSKVVNIPEKLTDEGIIDQLTSQLSCATPLKNKGLHTEPEMKFYQKIRKLFFKNN